MKKLLFLVLLLTVMACNSYNFIMDNITTYNNTHVTVEECDRYTKEVKNNPNLIPD